jgi:hypothetical protein
MESMQWFHEEEMQDTQIDSLEYQLPQLSEAVAETFAEDMPSLDASESVSQILELCHDQKKDAMQLCFINENDRLMQMYDEAVEQQLVHESDVRQLKEIEALCIEENEDDNENQRETFPNLDGILTVRKLEIQSSIEEEEIETNDDDDDVEVLQFSHIEISEVQKNAENLIEDVIKSLDDVEM